MVLQLNVTIEGEKQLSRILRDVPVRMENWRPALRKSSSELKKIFSNDVFSTQGRVIGERWQPLKPQYMAQKRRQGFSSKPLIKTGKLQKSFKSLVKVDSAVVWNAVAYAKYHQSNKPRRKLPRRVMMKVGNSQKTMIVKIFHTHFINKLKQTL